MDPAAGFCPPRAERGVARLARVAFRSAALLILSSCFVACKTEPEASASVARAERLSVSLGGPWSAAAGKVPTATNAFGYAVSLGKAQPILAAHGLDYKGFVPFNNGPPVVQAVVAGSVQIGTLGDTPAVSGRAGGADTRAIIIDRPVGDAWLLAKKSGVTSTSQLAGKKVGLQFGSNFDKYGRGVLEAAGILSSVELVNVTIADGLGALTRGDVDAYALPAASAALWIQREGFAVLNRASTDNPELQGTSVTIVSSELARSHPELPGAWWAATQAGIAEIRRDPEGYLRFVSDATGLPLAIVKQTTPIAFAEHAIDPAGRASVQTTLDFLLKFGTAKARFELGSWIDEPG